MNKVVMVKIGYVLMAVFFLGIAWYSFRNLRTITYVYQVENQKKESTYRYVEYLPGDRVTVSAEGALKDPLVTTEPLGRGTVLMIEGYGLGADRPIQKITVTYYVDLLNINADTPDLTEYIKWTQEYNFFGTIYLNKIRMIRGESAFIAGKELSVVDSFSLPCILSVLVGFMCALLLLIQVALRYKVKMSDSAYFAIELLQDIKSDYEESVWDDAKKLGIQYKQRYTGNTAVNLFCVIVVLCMGILLMVWSLPIDSIITMVVALSIVTLIISFIASQNNYRKFFALFSETCHPLASAIAFTQMYGSKQEARMRLHRSYPYQSIISLSFYYMGEFEVALSHLKMVWEETPGYFGKKVYFIHYHNFLKQIYRMIDDEESWAEEVQKIEAFLKQNPMYEKSRDAQVFRKQEQTHRLIQESRYTEAEACLNLSLSVNTPRYYQVAVHYQLWQLAKLQGNEEQMHRLEAFIEQYGRNFFFYERIKCEQQ